jgi:NADPH-dependent 2,4-dienoyl-CoA reductase/sulfur reductase-like enzyme
MADGLTLRGLSVTLIQRSASVLKTVDPSLSQFVADELKRHGVEVVTGITINQIEPKAERLLVSDSKTFERATDLVIVAVGVNPATQLAQTAGIALGIRGAIQVNRSMETNVPDIYAAGDVYYLGAHSLRIRVTGDRVSGRLIGAQIAGHYQGEVAKRIDIFATALFHGMTIAQISDLDLSYTPPLSRPWDAVQAASQAWEQSISGFS